MVMPVGTSLSASPRPTRRGNLCVPPAPGTKPKTTSGNPMHTSLRATRQRHAKANSAPPPRTVPCSAATQGTVLDSIRFKTCGRCGGSGARSNSLASAPAAKQDPAPDKMTLSSPCVSAQTTASSKPCRVSRLIAFTGGLFSRTRPQIPSFRHETTISHSSINYNKMFLNSCSNYNIHGCL